MYTEGYRINENKKRGLPWRWGFEPGISWK
jgi:hypothetical protein